MRMMTASIVALAALAGIHPARAQERVDVWIRNGSVYDGTGAAPRSADVGVRGDRIVFVGRAPAGLTAARTIDAKGLIVVPGFIDPHTHTDGDLRSPERRGLPGFLLQGVTTVIVGSDGRGPIDVANARAAIDRDGAGTNVAFLVGHTTARQRVLGGSAAAPTPVQLDSMRTLIAKGMREGAFGISTGLYYAPASYASTEEVIALSKVVGEAGGYYDSHIRDESSYSIGLLAAVEEVLRIGREAKLPTHIAHIKALGVDVWGKSGEVIDKIQAARKAGQKVTADQYPYTASGSGIGASLLPRWAEAGGRDSLRRRLADPTIRDTLVAEMRNNLRRRGGPDALLITAGQWKGRRLSEVAKQTGVDPIDAAITIVAGGDAGVASFNMQEADIDNFMQQDFVVTGSDGSGGHPRKFGTFPRKLRRYVLDRGVITLARAVEASSRQTAEIVGIADRGVLAAGKFADVVVLDSTRLIDRSTYESPEELAEGIVYVLVNGRVAVDGGKPNGTLAGRALARPTRR